jgi:membrane protease YdiL (CAAX protease family)
MKLSWPPAGLGLSTTLNLALPSQETRAIARRDWWFIPVAAVLVPAVMLGLDQLLVHGSSLPRLRELGSEPLPYRLLILVFSAVTEEVIYRLGIATLLAWLSYAAFSRRLDNAKAVSQWIGIVVAAFLFGLAHVGNLPHVAHPLLRAITLNGELASFSGGSTGGEA